MQKGALNIILYSDNFSNSSNYFNIKYMRLTRLVVEGGSN